MDKVNRGYEMVCMTQSKSNARKSDGMCQKRKDIKERRLNARSMWLYLKGQLGEWDPLQPQWQHWGELWFTQGEAAREVVVVVCVDEAADDDATTKREEAEEEAIACMFVGCRERGEERIEC